MIIVIVIIIIIDYFKNVHFLQQAQLGRLPHMKSLYIYLNMQTTQAIACHHHTFYPSLSVPTPTLPPALHLCHLYISTGQHSIIKTLMLHIPSFKLCQSAMPHHLSHILKTQKTTKLQILTSLSSLQRHSNDSIHPAHHHLVLQFFNKYVIFSDNQLLNTL